MCPSGVEKIAGDVTLVVDAECRGEVSPGDGQGTDLAAVQDIGIPVEAGVEIRADDPSLVINIVGERLGRLTGTENAV